MSKEERFLVNSIITFNNGEVFLPTPIICVSIEDAKRIEAATFNTVDKEIVRQVDVYIDVLPTTLKRESHNSWRR